MTTRFDAFKAWWDNGYRDIIPVVPPDAPLSDNSYIKKNNAAGKAPGLRYANGLWGGMPGWREHVTTEIDVADWFMMNASVGLRRGAAFNLDIDAYDPVTADMIEALAIEMLGPAPCRVGEAPKRSLLYRAVGEIHGFKLTFDGNNRVNQIEIPAQMVVWGIHPRTGKPYTWPRNPTHIDKLSGVTPEQLQAFFDAARRLLPKAQRADVTSPDREGVDQRALKGKLPLITQAMEALPNTRDTHPTYDHMVKVGNALKAATVDHPNKGVALWHDWCQKWEGGDYNEDLTEKRWASFGDLHSVGASWLYEQADKFSGRPDQPSFSGLAHFDPYVPDDNPFAVMAEQEAKQTATDTYKLLTIDEIVNRPPPTWLLARHVPEKAVGFLYSEPGVGKSFLALDMGLSIAHGLADWHGDDIRADEAACVIYIASEGSYGFRNRIKAWRAKRGLPAGVGDKRFFLLEQSINFMKEDDVAKLLRTLSSVTAGGAKPCLVIVDTVSRALPGADENLQKDMTLFVRACDAVKDTFGCAVLGVHHSSKQGGMRGSTVLLGAGDFVFSLSRKKGATIGMLSCEKQKDGPDGWEEPYLFETISVGDNETSLVVGRSERGVGPSVTLTPNTANSVLDAMRAAWDAGAPWSKAPQSKERYAVRHMVSDFGFDGVRAEETLLLWEQTGLIAMETRDAKSKIRGLKVVVGPVSVDSNSGIFE